MCLVRINPNHDVIMIAHDVAVLAFVLFRLRFSGQNPGAVQIAQGKENTVSRKSAKLHLNHLHITLTDKEFVD